MLGGRIDGEGPTSALEVGITDEPARRFGADGEHFLLLKSPLAANECMWSAIEGSEEFGSSVDYSQVRDAKRKERTYLGAWKRNW